MLEAHYRPVMGKKTVQRSIRLASDLIDGVQTVAEHLAAMGLQREANWTEALGFCVRYLKNLGLLENPDDLIQRALKLAQERTSDPALKPKK